METETNRNIHWSVTTHAMIREGGTWAVPRSGLIFIKNPKGFALTSAMPWDLDMGKAYYEGRDVPASAKELLDYQRTDYECIKRNMAEAGLTVTDPKGLL